MISIYRRKKNRYLKRRYYTIPIISISEIYRDIFNTQGLGEFVLKFSAKIPRESRGSCKLNRRGYEKLARFSTNVSLYFENGTRYGHRYNGRRQELVCDLSTGAIFNDLE